MPAICLQINIYSQLRIVITSQEYSLPLKGYGIPSESLACLLPSLGLSVVDQDKQMAHTCLSAKFQLESLHQHS
jgi:hypothetical protein